MFEFCLQRFAVAIRKNEVDDSGVNRTCIVGRFQEIEGFAHRRARADDPSAGIC